MAKRAVGTKLKIGTNSIAEITSIGGLELSADTIDVTSLDSDGGYREFIGGFKDAGEVSISGFFNPSDTNGQMALYNSFESGTTLDYTILFPSALGAEWQFKGVVTGFTTGAELEEAVSFEGTIKVSGKPSLGITPSVGLSDLVLTGTGGTLSPTFDNGVYYYTFDGVTASSVTVIATAASHTLKLYVDGTYVEDLVSGTPSSTIAVSLGSKKLTILATEEGKTTKTYEVVVVKTA